MNAQNAYMIYNGTNSADLGVCLRAAPTIVSPIERVVEQVDVPGRDGKIVLRDGAYTPMQITVRLATLPNTDLSQVRKWLRPSGCDLIFGDDTGKRYRNAHIIKEYRFTPCGVGRTGRYEFEVTFQCDPFLESVNEPSYVLNGGSLIENRGTLPTNPIICITSPGAVDITFTPITGDDSAQTLSVLKACEKLYIDCETGYAFVDTENSPITFKYEKVSIKPDAVNGDMIEMLPEKMYMVTFSGSTPSYCAAKPRWRWA